MHGKAGHQVTGNANDDVCGQQLWVARDEAGRQGAGVGVHDGFGNMTSKTGTGGAPSWSSSVDPTTNRLNNAGITFDANGNQTALPMTAGMTDAFTASYDVDNRMIQVVNSASTMRSEYDYDSGNKRVWERRTGNGSGEWIYFFGADGQRMGRYALTVGASTISFTQNQASVWFAGKLAQKVDASGTKSWPFEDRLGSVGKYLPYGEDKPGATNPANDNEKFATYTRDGGSGIDYADQRWYSQGVGRFGTADPYAGSAGPKDPSSWNRYTYGGGEPVGSNDPTGLLTLVIHGSFSDGAYLTDPEFMGAIAHTFGETPTPYYWSGNFVTALSLYAGIELEAARLAGYINSRPPGEVINIVAHSHGGSVVLMAYDLFPLLRPIDTLLTLGTPHNWDLQPPIQVGLIGNYCAVSSTADLVQVAAASPAQIYGFAVNSYLGVLYEGEAFWALLNGDLSLAVHYQSLAAQHLFWAANYWASTKWLPFANNIWITGVSHGDLHTAPVWNRIKGPCGL